MTFLIPTMTAVEVIFNIFLCFLVVVYGLFNLKNIDGLRNEIAREGRRRNGFVDRDPILWLTIRKQVNYRTNLLIACTSITGIYYILDTLFVFQQGYLVAKDYNQFRSTIFTISIASWVN